MIDWAVGVVFRRWEDTDYGTLRPYAEWYSTLSDQERLLRETKEAIADRDRAIVEKSRASIEREQAIAVREQAIADRDEAIAEKQKTQELLLVAEEKLCRERTMRTAMQYSLSWRVTEPIRRLMTALRSGPRTSG